MKLYVGLLALVFTICISCTQSGDATQPSAKPGTSLPTVNYRELGFPATDRVWTPADYQVALRIMRGLSGDQYPSSANPASALVMHRLTNPANLELFLDRTVPLDQRLEPCLDLFDAAKAIAWLYAAAHRKNPRIADDYMQMQGFLLQGVVAELSLLDEFVPTLDQEDPTYATRMAGLEKMKTGIAQMLLGLLLVMEDRQRYSSEAREQFAGIFSATFPTIAAQLPVQTQAKFAGTIGRIAREESNPVVKSALTELDAAK